MIGRAASAFGILALVIGAWAQAGHSIGVTLERDVSVPGHPVAAAVRPGNGEIWVSLEEGSLAVLDPQTLAVTGTVEDIGNGAWGLLFRPEGSLLYATDWMGHTIAEVDADQRRILRRFQVGLKPAHLALSPGSDKLYVTGYFSGELSVVDLRDGTTVQEVDVGRRPMGVSLSPSGDRAYVAGGINEKLTVVDLNTGSLVGEHSVLFATTNNLIPDRTGNRFLAPGKPKYLLSVGPDGDVKRATVGSDPVGVALLPGGSHAFVTNYRDNSLSVVDVDTMKEVAVVGVGQGPMYLSPNRKGSRLYVCNNESGTISVLRVGNSAKPPSAAKETAAGTP
jgi:YVTN family beta-propeller protein